MNILKVIREKTKLTKGDVQRLLGLKCWGSLSRVEQGKRLTTKEIAIGYHVLFGCSFEDMFSKEIKRTKETVQAELPLLIEDLKGTNNAIDVIERLVSLEELRGNGTN